ncbi:MAG: methyltransferase family protein [Terriglobales bacterium]
MRALAGLANAQQTLSMSQNVRRAAALVGFMALVCVWNHEAKIWRGDRFYVAGMFVVLTIVPVPAFCGRKLLSNGHDLERIRWITLFVHYAVMLAMGISIVWTLKVAGLHPLYVIPFPRELGWFLVRVTGSVVIGTVLTLALRGLGAPFAIALSKRLATDWLYRYTRNPMVVSLIAFFIAAGLWLQSTLILIWAVFALIPAELAVLKLYEERELELRFGDDYRAYKRTTPMFLGRRRKVRAATATSGQ